MRSVYYVVGFCPSCGTGPVGIRRCGGCHQLFALCDECDAIWSSPRLETKPRFLEQPDLPCPNCATPLASKPSHWAGFREIEPAGWQQHVITVARPFGWGAEEES